MNIKTVIFVAVRVFFSFVITRIMVILGTGCKPYLSSQTVTDMSIAANE